MNRYCKILVIDDEFIIRQGMKHMIDWEKEGFQIVGEASNGQEGLKMIESLRPNIVLADIVMPIIDGMELSKRIHNKYPEIQIIILSGYDKFEYVKSTLLYGAVDYILKPSLNPIELLKALKKAADRIPGMVLMKDNEVRHEQLIERYLLGYDERIDSVIFNQYFPNSCFRLFGTNLKQLYGQNKDGIKRMKQMLDEFFSEQEDNFIGLRVIVNEEYYLCVINYKLSKETYLLECFESLVKEFTLIQDKTHFILGTRFTKMVEIKDWYQKEFLNLADNFFYNKDDSLIKGEKSSNVINPIKKIDYILYSSYLNNKQFQEAIQILDEYINLSVKAKIQEYKLKNLTKNFIYNMLISVEQLNIDVDYIRQDYFYRLDSAYYVMEFLDVFYELIETLSNLIHQKSNSNNDRIQELMAYICEHSSESLDLTEVAKVFNFNYYYLSSYFNQHSEEGFSDYLNKIRIEKACELLKHAMLPIAEISNKVGYSDQSYFSRVFKKITGHTPSTYRRLYQ